MTRSFSPAAKAGAILAVLLAPACIVRAGQPHPLYPNPDVARPPAEIARLFGPIAAVDGQDVSRLGKSFALLPGCHIVRLADKVGEISTSNGGGFVGSTGAIFALRMKASHAYEIEIQLQQMTGPVGQMTIRAWERSADGTTNSPIGPATSSADIDDCRKWIP
jgi:hypothetical protein